MKYRVYINDRVLGVVSLPKVFDTVEVYDNIVILKIGQEIVSKMARGCFAYYIKLMPNEV